MELMGYGDQPYVVLSIPILNELTFISFRPALIVTEKKLSDSYEKLRSMNACRALRKKYQFPATEKNQNRRK
jgi:hypothetical protein